MGRIPEYRPHKASGRGTIQYKPLFGEHPFYLPGKYGSDESRAAYEDARQKVLEHQRTQAKPRQSRPSRSAIKVVHLVDQYMAWAKGNYSDSEYRSLRRLSAAMLEKENGTRVAEFGPLAFKRVREHMVSKGWTRGYINHQCVRMRRLFRWGVAEELVDPNIPLALAAVGALRKGHTTAPETKPREPVEWESVEAVLPFVPPMIRSMLHVQHLSGMRSDELVRINPREMLRDADVWIYSPGTHKTSHLLKQKLICLGPKCQAFLKDYEPAPDGFFFPPSTAIAERRTARGAPKHKPRKKPKARDTNKHYASHEYAQAIRHGLIMLALNGREDRTRPGKGEPIDEWLAERGVTHFTPHQLRHARATIVTEEHGLEAAAAVIGDSLQAAKIYSRKLLNLARKIALESG